MSIAFRPVINRYRGRASVEIHLDDWRVDGRQAFQPAPRAAVVIACAVSLEG